MSRCHPHRQTEPCYYCEKGYGPFANTNEWMEVLEGRVRELELEIKKKEKSPPNIDIQRSNGVVRMGGIGDLVALSSSLRALKQKEPHRSLVLVTKKENMDLLYGADYLDAVLPVDSWADAKFWRRYDLRWAVEDRETHKLGTLSKHDYTTRDRSDIFDELLEVKSDKDFSLPISQDILQTWKKRLDSVARPLIGIATTCTQPLREIPPEYIEPLVKMLQAASGGTIVLFGKTVARNKNLASIKGRHVLNFIDQTTIPDLVAAASLMDFMISPDTGLMHIAGALKIKTLALMGSIPPQCRVTYYPTVKPLYPQGELPCVPCWAISPTPNHGSLACKQPPKEYAECMRILTPERIMGEVKEMLGFINRDPEAKKVAFVHDSPLDYDGGAEISSRLVVQVGRELGYDIHVFSNDQDANEFYALSKYDLIILSNIWRFSFERMSIILDAIKQVPYAKYEHDHRSLDDLAEEKYPKDTIIEPLFRNSDLNIFVSSTHKEAHRLVLGAGGVLTTPLVDSDRYRPVAGVERKKNTALVGVPGKSFNPVGYLPSRDAGLELRTYMEEHPDIIFDFLYQAVPFDSMPELYSKYEYFIHLPQGQCACDRMVFEAALCGCKVVTNNNSGCLSWGKDLSDTDSLREWLRESPYVFWKEVEKIFNYGEQWTLPLKVSTG